MVELICGSAGSGKGEFILKRIRETLSLRKKMFLLVPEQEAVIWEERVCRSLPAEAGGSLDVLNFKRLANEVARKEGGLSRSYVTGAKRLLLMWSALISVKDELSVYSAADGFEDKYAALMLESFGEMKRNRVTPAMLQRASVMLSDGDNDSLSRRLCDLSVIFSAYESLCDESGSADPDGILDVLAEKLRVSDFFDGTSVFIDSFYSLTPAETEILYYIIKKAENVYITFDFDRRDRSVHFEHVREFFKKTVLICDRAGVEYKTIELTENQRTNKESLKHIEKNLWNFSALPLKSSDGSVRAIFCEDRYEEARAVGALIEKYVHEGARYSDIAVIAQDMEELRGIVDVRLDALHIPYHLSRRYELKTSPVVKLIRSLLACVYSGCRRENLVECLKTGLCPVSDRECADFEEYTQTWNIHGKKAFIDTELWSMNPAGYTNRLSERGRIVLRDANRVKGVLAAEIKKLSGVFDGGASVREICEKLCEVLSDFNVWEQLCAESALMKSEGKFAAAAAEEKIYSLVLEAFDTMVETVGDVRLDSARFSRLFSAVCASLNVGTIPSGVDMVTLGSAFGVRAGEVSHVILLGCVEGEFPGGADDGGFFSDVEKKALEKTGIILPDTSEKLMGEELFRFWRAASMPSETLTVLIPRSDGKGDAYPSIGAKRIIKLLGLIPESFSEISKRDAVWSTAGAVAMLPDLDERATKDICTLSTDFPEITVRKKGAEPLCADFDRISPAVSRLVYGDGVYLTQSRIDKYSNCPFSYYMNFSMNLQEPKTATVSAVDAGNFIHGILELFFSETKEREYPLPDEETENIVSRITEEYIESSMGNAPVTSRQKYLFIRLKRNVLLFVKLIMRELAGSSFRPFRFELPIKYAEGVPNPLVFRTDDGTAVSLYGKIDRVDTFSEDGKVYVKVVDYKTGKKVFDLSDVEKGLNLQLMIYLFTLWKGTGSFRHELAPSGEEIVPAGMLYFSAVPDGAKSDLPIANGEGEGIAASAVDVSGMMLDGTYEPPEKEASRKKSRVKVSALPEFDELYGKIEEIIVGIAEDMKGGSCESAPKQHGQNSPCRYCKLKPICRHIEGKEGEYDE